MARTRVNGVDLFYEIKGEGEPLVLVHGSWTDHHSWHAVLPHLTRAHRVLVYDRRGHSRSERPPGQGTRVQDEDDLAALVEMLGAPVHVAASSFGGSVALGLAARRPELLRSLAVHEPPLTAVVAGDPELDRLMRQAQAPIDAVMAEVRAGDSEAGARRFVEEVVFGPGAWEGMPDPARRTFVTNAPTAADEQGDPDWNTVDLDRLAGYTGPAMLSKGTDSPQWFGAIVDRLARVIPGAQARTLRGEGHVPHLTAPQRYADNLLSFLASTGSAPAPAPRHP
ncbi:alpha/beta fold hydrolase [Streptomyces erythrochromogenes]|uniref:alpha/beta fold hydrolase n=1 Tax=Streptomyces erythrochromogenes TaxID=285574 RepID=UPI003679F125